MRMGLPLVELQHVDAQVVEVAVSDCPVGRGRSGGGGGGHF